MKFNLREIAGVMQAEGSVPDVEVSGYSIDSRTLAPGDVFFAVKGAHFDGHNFINEVLERGASAVVAEREADHAIASRGVLLRVTDTLSALQALAKWARLRWGRRLVGVTGSAGKTTTKDVISHLLGVRLKVGKTVGNLNNHLGVPLSILRLPDHCDAAVLEMAMNHAGEIRLLADIGQPDIGVVTNAGYAHTENFDSIEGVALAKRELIEGLRPGGVAVLNADDQRVRRFGEVHSGKTLLYGISEDADIRAEDVEIADEGVRFRVRDVKFESPLMGMHSVRNILAGIGVAQVFGLQPEELVEAARSLAPGSMRGERSTYKGIQILNDCYNSNPEAARAMLDALRATPARRHIAVLGEMLELGRWSEPKHRELGSYAATLGIDVLVGIRGAAHHMVDAAMKAGLSENAAYFFSTPEEAGEHLRTIARTGDAILFKGSRGTRVERALEAFQA